MTPERRESNGKRYLSWPWLAGLLITIVGALASAAISDVKGDIKDARSDIQAIQNERVTRQEFNRLSDNVDEILRLMLADQRQPYVPSKPGPRQ